MLKEKDNNIYDLPREKWPQLLSRINDPPKRLRCIGTPPPHDVIYLTIIGSRLPTDYGRDSLNKLVAGLTGYPIVIVSGLALGIDGMAHEAAMKAGLKTISFPGSGLSRQALYPAEHQNMAERIVQADGCLLSEFPDNQEGVYWAFPQRNRLMAGSSVATLIIEGEMGSGSLITTRLALDYNRTVMALPGPIDSPLSAGPNSLIRDGAVPITCVNDILHELDIEPRDPNIAAISPERLAALDPLSRKIFDSVSLQPRNKDDLCHELSLPMMELNAFISLLEVDGLVRTKGNIIKRA